MDSGSNIGSQDPTWKYCTHMEGNRNGTVYNYCGLVIRSGEITHFKFHLSHSDPHSNTKKCSNVPLEVKQEMRQLLDQKNKEKAKKATDIEEICVELRGTMGGCDRHLIDDNEDEEEEEDDVYMYPSGMTPDERAEFRVACRASKATKWNQQEEEGFTRGKRKMGKAT